MLTGTGDTGPPRGRGHGTVLSLGNLWGSSHVQLCRSLVNGAQSHPIPSHPVPHCTLCQGFHCSLTLAASGGPQTETLDKILRFLQTCYHAYCQHVHEKIGSSHCAREYGSYRDCTVVSPGLGRSERGGSSARARCQSAEPAPSHPPAAAPDLPQFSRWPCAAREHSDDCVSPRAIRGLSSGSLLDMPGVETSQALLFRMQRLPRIMKFHS